MQMGSPTRAVMVDVDPRKLDAYNLTVEQVAGVLASNNLNLPSGSLEMGKSDLSLRLQGEFANSDAVKEIIVSNFNGKAVYLKAACDFENQKDRASFFYSTDGSTWLPVGESLKMAYTIPHFMGYRFGLFNYATSTTGGYADFDWFRISDKL